jgi:hypothetical protein
MITVYAKLFFYYTGHSVQFNRTEANFVGLENLYKKVKHTYIYIYIFIAYLPLYSVDIIHRIILSYSIVGIPTFCACVLIVTSKINVNYT